jgi:D-threo-aldose 1-dehydrogenase
MTSNVTMPQTTLGRTGITTSKLCLGAYGFGSASPVPARVGDDDEVLADILKLAFDAGIRLLDSAEAYDNEGRIGRVLSQLDVPEDLTIISKFGHGKGFGADQFKASIERTLTELNLQYLPIMMVHDPRTADDMTTILGPGGALEGIREMQAQGLVGYCGVATATLEPLQLAVTCSEFDSIQFPRAYTLFNSAAKSSGLLEAAREKGVAALAAAPFGGNILATGSASDNLYCYFPALAELIDSVQNMEQRCAELDLALPVAALAYAVTEPLVDSVVFGVTTTAELEQDLQALGTGVSRADLESVAAAGALDESFIGGPDFALPFPRERIPVELLNSPMRRTR